MASLLNYKIGSQALSLQLSPTTVHDTHLHTQSFLSPWNRLGQFSWKINDIWFKP